MVLTWTRTVCALIRVLRAVSMAENRRLFAVLVIDGAACRRARYEPAPPALLGLDAKRVWEIFQIWQNRREMMRKRTMVDTNSTALWPVANQPLDCSPKTRKAFPRRNAVCCSLDSSRRGNPARHFAGLSIGQFVPNMTRDAPTPFIQSTKSGGSLCKT